jgi:hypothetical protein
MAEAERILTAHRKSAIKKSRDFRSQLFAVLARFNPWKSVPIRGSAFIPP